MQQHEPKGDDQQRPLYSNTKCRQLSRAGDKQSHDKVLTSSSWPRNVAESLNSLAISKMYSNRDYAGWRSSRRRYHPYVSKVYEWCVFKQANVVSRRVWLVKCTSPLHHVTRLRLPHVYRLHNSGLRLTRNLYSNILSFEPETR